jgi:phosphatidylglycerol:prolipoprotein diacylglycerol transferase
MYPVLFRIWGLEVESFWVTVLVGFLVALLVARAELRRTGHDPDLGYDLILYSYVGGFAGARLFLVFSAWEVFVRDPFEFFFSGSGWVWQGGVIGGAVAVIFAAKRRGLPLGDVFDLAGPCLAVGQAIGRIGCQLSGDGDYGRATDVPWAMSYPHGVVPTDELVHPTPIYESVAYFVIFAFLWSRRWRPHIPGSPLGQYLIATGVVRFAVEFVRRNPVVALGLTLPQFASIASVAIGAALLLRLRSGDFMEWRGGEPTPSR